jgi:hypothetical protein
VCFLIGSAYFVSGSYPEGGEVDDEDDDIEASGSSGSGSFWCFKSKAKSQADPALKTTFAAPFLEKHNSNTEM